jgi:hypothetical protein
MTALLAHALFFVAAVAKNNSNHGSSCKASDSSSGNTYIAKPDEELVKE